MANNNPLIIVNWSADDFVRPSGGGGGGKEFCEVTSELRESLAGQVDEVLNHFDD